MRRFLVLLLLSVVALSGCRTGKRSMETLSFLRGQPVLVVAPAADHPPKDEAALDRALALVPVRSWPVGADATLDERLSTADARLDVAREEAEERRIPWLIVTEDDEVRVVTARGGEVRWEKPLKGASRSPAGRARVLRQAIGRGEDDGPELLDPDDVRLAEADVVVRLRLLAARSEWETHGAEVEALAPEFPADPAILVHTALQELLTEGSTPAADATLRRADAVNRHGESELLAVALIARSLGNPAVALRAREHLARLRPERLDYRPELADLQSEMLGDEQAIGTCLGGLGGVEDPGRFGTIPRGTAPDAVPDALPWADLSFSLGWYLTRDGRPEAALSAYEQAMEVYDALDRPRELADAMNNSGVALVEAGRAIVAVPMFRKAVKLRREQGRTGKAANSRHNLARALADSRRLDEAISTYEKAAQDYEALGDPLSAAESLYETLEHHAAVGDRPALEARAEDLLGRLESVSDVEPVVTDELRGSVWFELGQARMRLDDPRAALQAYDEALRWYRATPHRLYEAQTLYSMAVPNMALFRLDEAHANLLDALALAVELSDSASILDIRDQVGELRRLIRASGADPGEVPPALAPWLEE